MKPLNVRIPLGLCVALIPALPSGGRTVGYLCRADIVNEKYSFTARYPDEDTTAQGATGPVWAIEVRKVTGGETEFVWGVRWQQGSPAQAIAYGKVPRGYAQYYPAEGPPEPLVRGIEYELTCGLGRGRFRLTSRGVENLPLPSP